MVLSFAEINAIVEKRFAQTPAQLYYHNILHTMDVTEQIERIAREEGIEDEQILFLLKVAALYHDTGYLQTYRNHE